MCENAPPDDAYNATVRRIRQAHNYKELKLLVDRQLRWRSAQGKRRVTNYCNGRVDARNRQQPNGEGEGFCSRKALKCATTGKGKDEKSSKRQIISGADVNADGTNANGNLYDTNDDEYADEDADDSVANGSVQKVRTNVLQLPHSKQENNKQNSYKKLLAPKLTTLTASAESVGHKVTRNQRCATPLTKFSTYALKVRPHTVNYNKSKQEFDSQIADAALSSTERYLRLACEYYEQGVLRHINYLQAVGRQNAARREQRTLATACGKAPLSTRCSSNEETASRDSSANSTPGSTPRVRSAEHCFRLTNLLGRIGRKRSFKVGSIVTATNAAPAERLQYNPCAIRININPFVARVEKALKATRQEDAVSAATAPTTAVTYTARTLAGCSMNDYLNANSSTAITTTTVAARTHFHELVDHLMQLEISDIDASLPKITLTDCSTLGYAEPVGVVHTDTTATSNTNDNAFAFKFENVYNSNNFSAYSAFDSQVVEQKQQEQQQQLEQQVQTSARGNGFTLRQTKYGTLYSSLDIPDQVCYNSEARPP